MNPFAILTTVIVALSSPQFVSTDDRGLIGYFDGDCPDGWQPYNLGGRVIVGADDTTYHVGDRGGEESHTMTVDEMPQHSHNYSNSYSTHTSSSGSYAYTEYIYSSKMLYFYYEKNTTQTVGGNQAHNNMQPYLVLRACKKIKEFNYTELANQVKELNNTQLAYVNDQVNHLNEMLQKEIHQQMQALINQVKHLKIGVICLGTAMCLFMIYTCFKERVMKKKSNLPTPTQLQPKIMDEMVSFNTITQQYDSDNEVEKVYI